MALSAITFKAQDKPEAELSTMKEDQPLLEEQYLEKASVHLDNRLFVATTGTFASLPALLHSFHLSFHSRTYFPC